MREDGDAEVDDELGTVGQHQADVTGNVKILLFGDFCINIIKTKTDFILNILLYFPITCLIT